MYLHNWKQGDWVYSKQLQNENIFIVNINMSFGVWTENGQTAWQQLKMHHLVLTDLIELEK